MHYLRKALLIGVMGFLVSFSVQFQFASASETEIDYYYEVLEDHKGCPLFDGWPEQLEDVLLKRVDGGILSTYKMPQIGEITAYDYRVLTHLFKKDDFDFMIKIPVSVRGNYFFYNISWEQFTNYLEPGRYCMYSYIYFGQPINDPSDPRAEIGSMEYQMAFTYGGDLDTKSKVNNEKEEKKHLTPEQTEEVWGLVSGQVEVASTTFTPKLQEYRKALIKQSIAYKQERGVWVIGPGTQVSDIVKEINSTYGTKYSFYELVTMNGFSYNNTIEQGDILMVGTPDGWQPPPNPDIVDVDYWNDLEEEQQKILHYHRNFYQPISTIPKTLDEMNKKEWDSKGETSTHNIGASDNVDYRGEDNREGQQAIYDTKGSLVTSPENIGSYDFEESEASNNYYRDHADVDVRPWIEWGNSPQDSTTKQERICGMSKSFTGRRGLKYLDYDYSDCE